MSPSYFPLRWESTGDQWWFASPLDWAAANGHYDLVRELIRLDANHLIKLTSLRRIRRLETVWDDEEQFDDVAKCRSRVAQKLFFECESKRGKNSLIRAGHGGWLLYTAASAGDLGFARDLLEKNPLLVFGEGEYGVTDILYAAARSKNCEVFRLLFDFAASPRFLAGDGGELEEHIGEIPCDYKWDMVNRAVHAAARGGNLKILKVLLGDCFDVSAYRDTRGSTVLHAAAGRGQVEVVKDLIASFDIINSTDKFGNTALHVASYRGQLAVVEALILASPSSIYKTNKDGETFLHMAVSGFQTPSFRRLDRQIELMKQLVCGKLFDTEDIINAKNNDGRTALHLAIIGNIHSDLVEQIMSVRSIDVNDCDSNGMTPLDLLRKHPRSASSDILTRQLISAGGISYGQDYTASRTIASHLRMRSMGSPGTSFRISDSKIFLYTGIENASDTSDSTIEDCNESNSNYKKLASINYAAERLKRLLHWPRMKERKNKMPKKMVDGNSDENPIPLRQRFASLPNNKRTVSLRSNLPSPNAKKKFASGILVQGVMPDLAVPRLLFSSSFPKSSISSPECSDKQKCDYVRSDIAGPSCLNQISDKRLMNQYLRFGVSAPKEGLRKKRLGELRQAAKVRRYGSVVPISGSDFVREVSHSPPDVWVVVILYKDGYPECGLLLQCLEQLATKHPATKFVKIISTDCIPHYPDCNLPTLLVYNNSAVKANYVGLHNFGRRCTPEGVALVLCQSDPVLNDGQSGSEPSSREAVLKGVRQRLIEKVVRDHEDDDDDGSSSDKGPKSLFLSHPCSFHFVFSCSGKSVDFVFSSSRDAVCRLYCCFCIFICFLTY